MRRLLLTLAVLVWAAPASAQALPVVPGAFGFGMETRAAYGCGSSPTILRVTNRNNAGANSLRAALEATGPRVVIFEVGGYIDLSSDVWVTSPCLTVAGQTAPSPGITIRMVPGSSEAMFLVATHDVLLQHLRIRPGDSTCNSGIQVYGGDQYNVVFDHLSVSWAQDEGIAFTNATHDVTLWRSIVSETLHDTPGSESCTGGGLSGGHGVSAGWGAHITGLQNLLAHNLQRNFLTDGGGSSYYANNLIYNPGLGIHYGNAANLPGLLATVVSNYFKRGSTVVGETPAVASRYLISGSLYRNDNVLDNGVVPQPFIAFEVIGPDGIDPTSGVVSPPITLPGYTPLSGAATYAVVLANAGARPLDRDAVDTRIVQEVQGRTGNYRTTVASAGGYPALANTARSLTTPANPHTVTASSYTNLELWLQGFAAVVESASGPVAPPAPTSLQTTLTSTQVSLTWQPSPGATSYHVKRSLTAGAEVTVATVTSPAYLDALGAPLSTTYYTVTAVNAGGESGPSNEVSVLVVSGPVRLRLLTP